MNATELTDLVTNFLTAERVDYRIERATTGSIYIIVSRGKIRIADHSSGINAGPFDVELETGSKLPVNFDRLAAVVTHAQRCDRRRAELRLEDDMERFDTAYVRSASRKSKLGSLRPRAAKVAA